MVCRTYRYTDPKYTHISFIYSILIPNKILFVSFALYLVSEATRIDFEEPSLGKLEQSPPPTVATILKDRFAGLIKDNEVFIDKTILIKELLEYEDKIIIITRPRKWGKSVNLEMMKSFLQITVENHTNTLVQREETPNYKLFKQGELLYDDGTSSKLKHPLVIAKHEDFMNQHLARYSVIHTSFKGWRGNDYDKLIENFQNLMADIFSRHNYIKIIMQEVSEKNVTSEQRELALKNLDRFDKIIEKRANLEEMKTCIYFLSKILHEYLKKLVVVLIDDYEVPLIETIQEENPSFTESKKIQFIEFYQDFLRKSFENNLHLKKIVLTGVLRLVDEKYFHNSTKIPKRGGIDDRFFQFYGFTKQEVDLLLKQKKFATNVVKEVPYKYGGYEPNKPFNWNAYLPQIPKDIGKQVHDKYNGYESDKPSSLKIYNPYSIGNFIRSNEIRNFWLESDNINEVKLGIFIKNLNHSIIPKIVQLRGDFQSLLVSGEGCINKTDLHFHAIDYLILKNLSTKIDTITGKETADSFANLALSYLWAQGYLTYSHTDGSKIVQALGLKNSSINKNLVWFRIPNGELYEGSKISKEWHAFYELLLKDELMYSQNYFDDPILLHWHRYLHYDGNSMMSKSLQFIKLVCDKYGLLNGIDIVFSVIRQTSYEGKFEEYFRSRIPHHPDLVMLKKERIVLVKVTFGDRSAERALQVVQQYETILQQSNISDKIHFVGINVGRNWQMRSYTIHRVSKGWFNIDGDDALNYAGIGYHYTLVPDANKRA